MYEIYAIGDAELIARILNGVVMILGAAQFNTLLKSLMLMGVLFLSLSALSLGKFIPFQNLLLGWILFNLMFIPKATVAVTESSGKVYVVDNIPLGVAFMGSVISKTGKGFSDLMNSAFSMANSNGYGITNDFDTIFHLRSNILQGLGFNATNSKTGINLQQSWLNYLQDCTNTGLSLDNYAQNKIQVNDFLQKSLLEQVQFDSQIYHTQIAQEGNPNLNCTQAYIKLKQLLNNLYVQETLKTLHPVPEYQQQMSLSINQNLNNLSQGQLNAHDYIIATTMLHLINKTSLNSPYLQLSKSVENQSIQQRNSQWSIEANVFTKSIKPTLSFFEGLIYAITPFMACLVIFSLAGLKMIGKYLLLLIWLELWHPILAIINFFYHMAISQKLSLLRTMSLEANSYLGLIKFEQELENYLAHAAMFTATAGSIALLLVYGGSISATNLVNRLKPTDTIDEKSLAPNMSQSAPVIQQQASYDSALHTGVQASNTSEAMGKVNLANSIQTSMNTEQAQLQTQQQQLQENYSRAFSNVNSTSLSRSQRQELGKALIDTNSKLRSALESEGYTSSDMSKESKSHLEESVGSLAASAHAGLGFNFFVKAGAQTQASYTGSRRDQEGSELAKINTLQKSMSSTSSVTNALKESLSDTSSLSTSKSLDSLFSQQEQSNIGQSRANVQSTSQKLANLENLSHTLGSSQNFSMALLSQQIQGNPELQNNLSKLVNNNPELLQASQKNASFYQRLLPNEQQAKNAAMINALMQNNNSQYNDFKYELLQSFLNNNNKPAEK